jgi:hypothetical protein
MHASNILRPFVSVETSWPHKHPSDVNVKFPSPHMPNQTRLFVRNSPPQRGKIIPQVDIQLEPQACDMPWPHFLAILWPEFLPSLPKGGMSPHELNQLGQELIPFSISNLSPSVSMKPPFCQPITGDEVIFLSSPLIGRKFGVSQPFKHRT